MAKAKVSQSCYEYSLITHVIDQNRMHVYIHMYVYANMHTYTSGMKPNAWSMAGKCSTPTHS